MLWERGKLSLLRGMRRGKCHPVWHWGGGGRGKCFGHTHTFQTITVYHPGAF